jgi:hypothetical protein
MHACVEETKCEKQLTEFQEAILHCTSHHLLPRKLQMHIYDRFYENIFKLSSFDLQEPIVYM